MKGLQGERLRQAFRHFDTKETGYISPSDFQKIIVELAQHKLSDIVLDSLPTLCLLTPGAKISYSECIAFHNVRPRCSVSPCSSVPGHPRDGPRREDRARSLRPLPRRQDLFDRLLRPGLALDALRHLLPDGGRHHLQLRRARQQVSPRPQGLCAAPRPEMGTAQGTGEKGRTQGIFYA